MRVARHPTVGAVCDISKRQIFEAKLSKRTPIELTCVELLSHPGIWPPCYPTYLSNAINTCFADRRLS